MRSNSECWHGFKLTELPSAAYPGYVVGVAKDCARCAEEFWTTVAYIPGEPVPQPPPAPT